MAADWVSYASSLYLLPQTEMKIGLALIAAAVTVWLVRLPEVTVETRGGTGRIPDRRCVNPE